jgi:Family of unknown function (DUF6427)
MLRFFRSSGTQMIIFVPFLGVMLWLHSILKTPHVLFLFDRSPMPLYKFITGFLPATSAVATAITLALVVLQGLWLVRLNTRFIFINNRNYLPALLFILLCTSIPDLQRLNPVLLSGFFLLLAIEKVFESYRNNKLSYEYFVAAFYISIGYLFYPYLIFFIFFIWAALAVLKPFNWREWAFTIIGFLVPVFFTFSFYYLVYNDPLRIYLDFKAAFSSNYHFSDYHISGIAFFGFMVLLVLVASQFMIRTYTGMKILPRKAFTVIFWLFVNSIAVYLLVSQASVEMIFLVAIPLSYLFSNYFTFMKSRVWGNIILLLLLILIIWIQVE